MKCRYCKNKAIIKTIEGPLCKEHFKEFYLRTVKKTIEKYNLFKKNDKILVAVSGGKDSSALAYALYELDYEFEGLYINLEIPNYSEYCEKYVKELFKLIGYKLNIIRVSDYKVKVQRVGPRPVCSVCGIIKRYLMNKFAYENGFNVIATAHNLSDEAAFMLNNLYGGKLDYFLKQGPVIPEGPKLVKKVKPLYFLTEKENMVYSLINNLPVCHRECPNAKGNTQIKWKKALYLIDNEVPFFSYKFVRSMLNLKKYVKYERKVEWQFCKICGYPTEARDGICAFCKIRMYFQKRK